MENEKIIFDAIAVLANKLGTTGSHLWGVLIKQAFYSSCIDLITYCVICIATFVCAKIAINLWKKIDKSDLFILPSVLSTLIAGVGLIFCFCELLDMSNILSGLYNPEYWALDKVMQMILHKS